MARPRRGVGFARRLLLQALLAAAALALLIVAGLQAGWTALLIVLAALVVGALFPAAPAGAGREEPAEADGSALPARPSAPDPADGPPSYQDRADGRAQADPQANIERASQLDTIARALDGSDRIGTVLQLLAGALGGGRIALWQRDAAEDRLVPIGASADPPPVLPATGNALGWVLEQREPMRLERPDWTPAQVLALPLPGGGTGTLLTIEADRRAPAGEVGASVAGALAVLLDLEGHRVGAERTQHRLDRMLGFLRGIPGDPGRGGFPASLVGTAVDVTGASGGLVASWTGGEAEVQGEGEVLWTNGEDGGPTRGTRFGPSDGDLGMAARTSTTISREPGSAAPPPLATSEERWPDRPTFRVVLPLHDATGQPRALLALWGHERLEPEGVQLLEAVATLLALQLHNATDLVRFRRQATRDPLTGLANRGHFEEELGEERLKWDRYRRPVALMVLDLDHFKAINDTHGHPAGDAVLRQVAAILEERTRETDLVARYGGEEMVVLMPETMRTAAVEAAERVRTAIEDARVEGDDGTVIPVTASIGVSACPECVDAPGELMASADAALYRSKDEGRNRVTPAAVRPSGG